MTDARPSDSPVKSGLIANPFRVTRQDGDTLALGIHLTAHAQADKLRAAMFTSVEGDHRPIWVEKSAKWPDFYNRLAVSDVIKNTTDPGSTGVLTAYVPLLSMKMGRVRGALSTLSERLMGGSFPLALGRYVGSVLADPDESLPEWQALAGADLGPLLRSLEEDPAAGIIPVYGEHVGERSEAEDLELLMREAAARQGTLDKDPDASAETDETDDAIESDAAVITTIPGGLAERVLEQKAVAEAREATEHAGLNEDVAAYVEAYARAHLSPVVARMLTAYRMQGSSAAAQELKITKAPRKTLRAVGVFAGYAFKGVAILFDQFDPWDEISQDVRLGITSALSEMRWSLGDAGTIVVMSRAGLTPEIEEQFAAAMRVEWDYEGLEQVNQTGSTVADAPLDLWFAAATVAEPALRADDPVIAQLTELSEGDLERFVELAAPVVDEARARGAVGLDPAAIVLEEDATDEPEELTT